MSIIGPTYPFHIFVSEAQVRLVADKTANASTATIMSDQHRINSAQEIEASQAKAFSVDVVT
jgi:hypothetical protein